MSGSRDRCRIEEIVENLAHELCNPVFAITALVDAMQAELGAESPCGEYAQRLHREAARLREALVAMQGLAAAGTQRRQRRAVPDRRRAVHL